MRRIVLVSVCIILNLHESSTQGCEGAFKNVDVAVVYAKKSKFHNTNINGCIEKQQPGFRQKKIGEVHIVGQHVPMLPAYSIRNMPKLKRLVIDGCGVSSIRRDAFYNLPDLKEVVITRNNVSVVESNTFGRDLHIKALTLSRNQILDIQGEGFSNMGYLRLLDLSRNKLSSLRKEWFQNIPRLGTLALGYNRLTTIGANTFSGIPNLNDLHLEYNVIAELANSAFGGFGFLRYLNLRNNRLARVEAKAFPTGLQISQLFLSVNKLNFLPEELFKLVRVEKLFVDGNPLLCQCMDAIRQWLKNCSGALKSVPDCDSAIMPFCVFSEDPKCNEQMDHHATQEYYSTISNIKYSLNKSCVNIF